jgi:hypothetical protein
VGERRLKNVIFILEWAPPGSTEGSTPSRHLLMLSLAEGETLRRLIHTAPPGLREVRTEPPPTAARPSVYPPQ